MKIVYLIFDLAWFLFFSFIVAIPFWILIQISQTHETPLLYILSAAAYGSLSVIAMKKIIAVLSSTHRWKMVREKIDTVIQSTANGGAAAFVRKWEYIALVIISAVGFAQTAIIISENSRSLLPHGGKCVHLGVFLSAFIAYFFFRGGSQIVVYIIDLF